MIYNKPGQKDRHVYHLRHLRFLKSPPRIKTTKRGCVTQLRLVNSKAAGKKVSSKASKATLNQRPIDIPSSRAIKCLCGLICGGQRYFAQDDKKAHRINERRLDKILVCTKSMYVALQCIVSVSCMYV